MLASNRKSENAVQTVQLMDRRPTRPSKVKQRITHQAFDHRCPLSATLQQTVKFQVSTLANRAAWSINRAMGRWDILQQTLTHIRRMPKATHNTLNNVSRR